MTKKIIRSIIYLLAGTTLPEQFVGPLNKKKKQHDS